MKAARIAGLAPDWLLTYAGVILLVGVLVNLASGFAQFTYNLTLPSMRDSLHLSYTQAGILVTGAAAVRMGSSLVFGTLAPRYGSRVIIGASTVATGGAMLLLGASPNFLVALLAMVLLGIASGGALTPMMGLLSAWFAASNRGLTAGLAAAGGSVAFVMAGTLVPWLTSRSLEDGWRHTWYLFGVLVMAAGALALLFLRERPQENPGAVPAARLRRGAWPLEVYRNPLVWLVAGLAFFAGWASGIFNTFFGSYLSEENGIDLAVVGRLLVLIGVLSGVSGILWGKLSDWLGRGAAFHLSFLVQGAGFALLWIRPEMGALVVSAVLMGLTLRATYTICAAAAGDYVPVHFSAAAFALMSVGAGLGNSLSPVVGGAIADAGALRWAFGLATGAAALGVAGGFWLQRTPNRREERT